ncbi:hypothetical protein BAR24066_07396 [Burkholderia arboris]|uniref:Uncharacterized protein n=1 Tax=Burkholderia arboris TaxID=488730 RepID=A0A9Q9SRR5_9BURK|nr:hypothetical protein BAR24066_07396 [Burkholderia arboris]
MHPSRTRPPRVPPTPTTPRHDLSEPSRLAVLRQDVRRVDAGAVPRPVFPAAAPVLGDGERLHRVEPVRRRDAFEGAVPRARHRARRGRRDLLRAAVRRDTAPVQHHRRDLVRHAALPRDLRPHRAQLRVHARRLHDAPDRAADRDRSIHRVRRRDRADRGNRARHRVRERGRQRGIPEPACADADRAHRCMVQGRRVLRPRDAVRAPRRQGAVRVPAAARGDDHRPRVPAEPVELRPCAPAHPRTRTGARGPDAAVPAADVVARRSADRADARPARAPARARRPAGRRREVVRRAAAGRESRHRRRHGPRSGRGQPARAHRRAAAARQCARELGWRADVERAVATAPGHRHLAGLPLVARTDRE